MYSGQLVLGHTTSVNCSLQVAPRGGLDWGGVILPFRRDNSHLVKDNLPGKRAAFSRQTHSSCRVSALA